MSTTGASTGGCSAHPAQQLEGNRPSGRGSHETTRPRTSTAISQHATGDERAQPGLETAPRTASFRFDHDQAPLISPAPAGETAAATSRA